MRYRSETIGSTVGRLNHQYFLPAIQREFVWKPEGIISLFDSIMRGYPISSFLFWELKDENKDNWEAYTFIDKATQGGTHNELTSTDGVHQLVFVLDGQQRLTSLLIGLKGVYTVKIKHRRWKDPRAWVKQRLYLDLLKDPNELAEDDGDGEAGIYYGFAFWPGEPRSDAEHQWFRVGKILDFDNEDAFYEFRDKAVDDLPDEESQEDASCCRASRLRGGFSFPTPNDYTIDRDAPLVTYDITSGAVDGLCEARWAAVTRDETAIWVNLLFSREAEGMRVVSYLSREGRIEIENRSGTNVMLRIPSWAPVDDVTLKVDGRETAPRIFNSYLLIPAEEGTWSAVVTFPLRQARTVESICYVDYTIEWRGDQIVAMSPPAKHRPMFPPCG